MDGSRHLWGRRARASGLMLALVLKRTLALVLELTLMLLL